MNLNTPIENISNFGSKLSPHFKKLGLTTARDLLFYFPYRWDDLSEITPIGKLEPDSVHTIKGRVEFIENKRSWKKRIVITQAIVSDTTGKISVVWFNQHYIGKNIQPGDEVYLSGKTELDDTGVRMSSPEYEKITSANQGNPTHTARIVPRYSSTGKISQKQFRFFIKRTLPLTAHIPEWLHASLIQKHDLLPLSRALSDIHYPRSLADLHAAQERMKFDELLFIQLRALLTKHENQSKKAHVVTFHERESKKFVTDLPFSLTNAQKKSAWEILKNMERPTPMNRLLEGDVGSGKTVVAALAILNVFLNKKQTAYMAPTEVLARQVFSKLSELLMPSRVHCALLTRTTHLVANNVGAPQEMKKKDVIALIQKGEVDLVVGTHALIQDAITFHELTLSIVDEQHRFGVGQRASLAKAGAFEASHFLSMSATPIPRSLALTVYGDLDLSIIDEMPKGRKKIRTKIIPPDKRAETYSSIQTEIQKGRQAYVICPLIDPSDKLGVKSATDEYKKLNQKIFPEFTIELLHGRMSSQKKNEIMSAFYENTIQILVSTTVVEVGIDVSNATIIVIEGAERFGLAQLHQLRGRVGRGKHQSHCFLFTETENADTLSRLRVFANTSNGFELAEADLEFRGPGEVYGVRQAGFLDRLKIAKLTDYPIIQKARAAAETIIDEDPKLETYPLLKERLRDWEEGIHLE